MPSTPSLFKQKVAEYLRGDSSKDYTIDVSSEKTIHFAQTIRDHILNNKKIFVYGDYDVDGIFSTIMMTEIIKDVAKINNRDVNLEYRVPSRAEHYGIKYHNFEHLVSSYDLIITVDNGTHKDFYNQLTKDDKKKLLVLDHHPNGDFQEEQNIINPNTDGTISISTGILIDFLHQGMRYVDQSYARRREQNYFRDLAAITLISDMANINNKYIRSCIKKGLKVIAERSRPAYNHFFPEWKKEIEVEDVAFNLIPKINSVGRLGLELDWIVKLFHSKKETEFVKESLLKLEDTNEQRKDLQNEYTKIIEKKIQESGIDLDNAPLVYFHSADVPIGLNGLIAGNISQKYKTNAVFTSINFGGDMQTIGSGRGNNIKEEINALFQKYPSLKDSTHFGGHLKAIGLRTSNPEILLESVKEYGKTTPKNYTDNTKKLINENATGIEDYLKYCKDYYEICGSIPLNSSFYAKVSLLILGFNEYRNDYIKLVCQDRSGDLIEIITKNNADINIYSEEYIETCMQIKSLDPNSTETIFTDLKELNSFGIEVTQKKDIEAEESVENFVNIKQ